MTVSVLSFSGRRVLSCWCRLCAVFGNGMFSVKSLQAQRGFLRLRCFQSKNVLQSVFVDAFLYNLICFVPRLKSNFNIAFCKR